MILLDLILTLIATFFIIFSAVYYIILLIEFIANDLKVKTKKEFIKCLIPFYYWLLRIRKAYNRLDD